MSGFKLYEIASFEADALAAILALDGEIDEATGEQRVSDDWRTFLNDVAAAKEQKALDVARYIKALDAEAEAISAEAKRLVLRSSTAERQADKLKEYLAAWLQPGEKIKDANTAISWRKSASVSVPEDATTLPVEYRRVHVDADKTKIKATLAAGHTIAGCSIVEKQSIQIK